MSLKTKVVLLTSLLFILMLGVTYAVQQKIIMMSFGFLERRYAADDMTRCVRAVQNELEHLSIFCSDWSAWDDTYNYVQGKNEGFITANMMATSFSSNRLNLICIGDRHGRIIWSKACELPMVTAISLSPFTDERLPADSPLLDVKRIDSVVKGVVLTERGPMLVCSQPILTSNNEGPIQGFMIMGRFLDQARVRELSTQTAVDFTVYPLDRKSLPAECRHALSMLGSGNSCHFDERDATVLDAYAVMPGIDGSPALLLRAEISRAITGQGAAAIRFAVLCSIVADAIIVFLMWRWLHRIVVDPIRKLTDHAVAIAENSDLSAKVEILTRDEIGSLAGEFNRMVSSLADFRAKLLGAVHKLRATLDGLRDAVLILDAAAETVLDCNPAASETFRLSWGQMIGLPTSRLCVNADDCVRLRRLCGAIGGEWKPVERLAIQMLRADGSVFPVEFSLIPISDQNARWVGWVCVVTDLTDRQRAESEKARLREQLFHAQKMDAVGQLASSVSHDFTNFLAVVRGGTDRLRRILPEEDAARSVLNSMSAAANQATEVARSLMTLARPTANEKQPVNLCEVVEEARDLMGNLLPESVEVLVEAFVDDPLMVHANRTQLQQVMLNLVINARDAMPQGGTVRLALTRARPAADGDASLESGDSAGFVVLTVSDTGQGMSTETLARLFESFFTTKESGSGLGLAIVRSIVEDHTGTIDVQSSPGTGTTFTIRLPLMPINADQAGAGEDATPGGHGEVLLLLAGGRHTREMAASSLESFGYRVLQTADVAHALVLCESHGGSVRLLIVDADDLAGGGLEHIEPIRGATGNVPVILLTSGENMASDGDPGGNAVTMRKPFRMADLALLVKAELGRCGEAVTSHG